MKKLSPDDPRLVLSGIGTAFDISDLAQQQIEQAELIDRVCEFANRFPSETTRTNRPQAVAIFEEARALYQLAGENVSDFDGCLPKNLEQLDIEFDFTFPTYDEFECDVDEIFNALLELPETTVARFAPRGSLFFATGADSSVVTEPVVDSTSKTGIRKWIAKIFAGLGIKSAYQAILEILDAEFASLMASLGENLALKRWRAVGNILKSIFRTITSSKFLKKLGEKIGVKVASKIVGQVASKFVPFLGWGILVGSIIWAFAEEFI